MHFTNPFMSYNFNSNPQVFALVLQFKFLMASEQTVKRIAGVYVELSTIKSDFSNLLNFKFTSKDTLSSSRSNNSYNKTVIVEF